MSPPQLLGKNTFKACLIGTDIVHAINWNGNSAGVIVCRLSWSSASASSNQRWPGGTPTRSPQATSVSVLNLVWLRYTFWCCSQWKYSPLFYLIFDHCTLWWKWTIPEGAHAVHSMVGIIIWVKIGIFIRCLFWKGEFLAPLVIKGNKGENREVLTWFLYPLSEKWGYVVNNTSIRL